MGSQKPGRIPELDGLRVLMIFVVSWYHIWQQSWLGPGIVIPEAGIYWSLDWLVRSGYVWVDGTVLLSAFLMYLPLARKGRSDLPDARDFWFRKAKRILPGYWFIVLAIFLGICLPWNLYNGNGPYIAKDLFTHFTLIFPFWRDTYINTPIGAASWTLAIVAAGYLLFPLMAKGLKRHPARMCALLCLCAFAFRAWCLWGLTDYAMVVNTCVNFRDVYAAGFGCAILYARLEKAWQSPARTKGKTVLWETAATLVFFGCLFGLYKLLYVQAYSGDHVRLQASQMQLRPAFALLFGGLVVSAHFCILPLRFLLGNPVTAFLSAISMNYYLIHQTLAVHLRRIGFPPSASDTPNMALEQPWQTQYTWACFGFSLAAAVLVTFLVEKPAGRLLENLRAKHLKASGTPRKAEPEA